MRSITVDLGGTRTKVGLVENGNVTAAMILDARSDGKLSDSLPGIEEAVDHLIRNNDYKISDFAGIGFAYPGIVNYGKKKIISPSGKYEDGPSLDLEKWCEEKFGIGMVIENDANAALLGEMEYGCARDYESAVLMILGTGVGTAAVIEGKILRGKHHQAGCLGGHFITSVNGNKCTCGGTGCLEANASTWALPGITKKYEGFSRSGLSTEEVINFRNLEKWARKGDALAEEVLEQCILQWSAGIVNLIHAYDPEVVIMSGGVMMGRELILPTVIKKVREWAWTPWGEVEFVVSENPEQSVLLGLHSLVEEMGDYYGKTCFKL